MIGEKRIGNAQTIGSGTVQSNFFSTGYNEAGDLFSVLADGTVDHYNGRMAAVIAVKICMREFLQKPDYIQADEFFLDTSLKAARNVNDFVYAGKTPHLSLTMTLSAGRAMNYFNVGSNKVVIYDGRNERILDDKQKIGGIWKYACGELGLAHKMTAGILSTGVYSALHPIERIRIIKSKIKVFDKAQSMIQAVNSKNLENQSNATVILIEGMR